MTAGKLTEAQRFALALASVEGRLVRRPGGFWTAPSIPSRWSDATGAIVPAGWTQAPTLKALERRGLVALDLTADPAAPLWRTDRVLTDAGRAAL